MDNQHRKIKGYRELSQEEIDLMNRIKAFGPELETLVQDIQDHVIAQFKNAQGQGAEYDKTKEPNQAELFRLSIAQPYEWIEEGKKNLQTGLMFLTRAIAQPGFF